MRDIIKGTGKVIYIVDSEISSEAGLSEAHREPESNPLTALGARRSGG